MDPQTPRDPKSELFPDIPRFAIGIPRFLIVEPTTEQ